MKRILLALVFFIGMSISALAQNKSENYIAFRTEIYNWKSSTEEWVFDKETVGVTIPIYFVPLFIHIEAKQHGYFLLSRDEPETINNDDFSGYSYNGYDLRMELNVKVHVLDMKLTRRETVPVLSIIYPESGINIRYYLKPLRK